MASANVTQARIFENSAAVLMARIVDENGDVITQDDVADISCAVYDAEEKTLITSPTVTVTDNIFSTLQKNNAWDADRIGFNLRIALSGDSFPLGGRLYLAEALITPSGDEYGSSFYVQWELQTIEVLSA